MLLLGMLTLQGGAALAKGLFPLVGGLGSAGLRVTLAALILTVVFRPDFRSLGREEWRLLLPYGLTLGAMNLIFYAALERLPLGLAVAIEFSGPLLLAAVLSKQARDLAWVVLAAAGIVLLTFSGEAGDLSGGVDTIGVLLAMLAGACWAAYILFGSRVGQRISGTMATAAGMWIGASVTAPVALFSAGTALFDGKVLLLGLSVALLSSALPYTLEMKAMRYISPQVLGILSSLEPAVAALAGMLVLGEHLEGLQWIAILLVMTASVGISIKPKSKKRVLHAADTRSEEEETQA